MNNIIQQDIEYIVNSDIDWKRFSNKTVLISGGNGFLAFYILKTLLYLNDISKLNIIVVATVRDIAKAKIKFQEYLHRKDLVLIENNIVNEIPYSSKIDFLIHSASQASPKYYRVDPVGTLEANIFGTTNMLKLALKNHVESFLFFSSGEVYGEVNDNLIPISENTFGYLNPTILRSCYAESKRMGENICVSWFNQYNINAKIVRPFHTYGPGMSLNDGRVFADFVSNVVKDENILIKSDGSAIRAYCYIVDATIGFFKILLEGKNGEAYNIGNPYAELSVRALANLLVGLFPDKNLKVSFININEVDSGYLQSPLTRNSPNIDKVVSLNWKPKYSPEEGFQRTILSYTSNI